MEGSCRSRGIAMVRESEHPIEPRSLFDGGWISNCGLGGVSFERLKTGFSHSRTMGCISDIRIEESRDHGLVLREATPCRLFARRLYIWIAPGTGLYRAMKRHPVKRRSPCQTFPWSQRWSCSATYSSRKDLYGTGEVRRNDETSLDQIRSDFAIELKRLESSKQCPRLGPSRSPKMIIRISRRWGKYGNMHG